MNNANDWLEHIKLIHATAVEAGEMAYVDPQSGYQVFTELFHIERGACCHSSCRHCPYR